MWRIPADSRFNLWPGRTTWYFPSMTKYFQNPKTLAGALTIAALIASAPALAASMASLPKTGDAPFGALLQLADRDDVLQSKRPVARPLFKPRTFTATNDRDFDRRLLPGLDKEVEARIAPPALLEQRRRERLQLPWSTGVYR